MQSLQTVTLPPDRPQPDLRIRAERPVDTLEGQLDFQPVIDRLRIVYLQHINCNDKLSVRIQDIAAQFIFIDCSRVSRLSDIVKIAQDCKKQFYKILDNDFDQALLEEPVFIPNWKFEEWQLKDFISLDKCFENVTEK